MRAYCGQTREARLIQILKDHNIGECTVRGELKSRKRDPWFYDNGAYRDWTAGEDFNALQFARDCRRMRGSPRTWKIDTARGWTSFAHERGLRCHVGRVGTPERVAWARAIGADSIDSCLPIMFTEHLTPFLAAVAA